ncbi:unnamed protein product, partial [Sphenostylis stenocarpa]
RSVPKVCAQRILCNTRGGRCIKSAQHLRNVPNGFWPKKKGGACAAKSAQLIRNAPSGFWLKKKTLSKG